MRGDTSLIVGSLESRIRDWRQTQDGVLLLPKEAFFNEALVRTYRSFGTLLERMVEFTALVTVVPREAMTAEAALLYRRMKGMECELSWSGLVKPTPHFVALQRPESWRTYMPKVRTDKRLLKALNSQGSLMDTIRKLKPAALDVALVSLHSGVMPDGRLRPDQLLQSMAEFYNEPTTVTWGVSLRTALPQLGRTKTTLNRCYELLDLISKTVREVSEASKDEEALHLSAP